jgi:hypothetical protein
MTNSSRTVQKRNFIGDALTLDKMGDVCFWQNYPISFCPFSFIDLFFISYQPLLLF